MNRSQSYHRDRARIAAAGLDAGVSTPRQLLLRMDLLNASLTVELAASGGLTESQERRLNEIERLLCEAYEEVPRD